MDQRLIAQASALGLALESNQHLGVDANGDELSRDGPQWRASDTAHGPELLGRELGNVGVVNSPPPRRTPPAPCGSLGAR